MQLYAECPARLGRVVAQPLQYRRQLLYLLLQIPPRRAGCAALRLARRLALPHGQAEGPLHGLLTLQLPGWTPVKAPDMISGEILDVLPIKAEQLHRLVVPPSIGVQLLIGRDATVAE